MSIGSMKRQAGALLTAYRLNVARIMHFSTIYYDLERFLEEFFRTSIGSLWIARMGLTSESILQETKAGLYCPAGDFYIDPVRPVPKAVITHAHSDHARPGSDHYLATELSAELLKMRLGQDINLQVMPFGKQLVIDGVQVSLHPAGHILGSAQVRIEVAGQVAVVTGDYKLQPDLTATAWEPVRCHLLVTESTFGLPIFRWPKPEDVLTEILEWWQNNQREGKTSILLGYSVGKAQRVLKQICDHIGKNTEADIWVHGALLGPLRAYRDSGIDLPVLESVLNAPAGTDFSRSLIIAPPSTDGSAWLNRFRDTSIAMASGWMAIRGTKRRRSLDRGFVISDHVDWGDLLQAIDAYQPEDVWVTHGFSDQVARYLNEKGVRARATNLVLQREDE